MFVRSLLSTAALIAGATAQVATYSSDNYAISVNVPSNTASSKSGPIYLQISAPSDTQWVGFGQGSSMSGSNMVIVYAASSSNVTVSPRLGTGYVMPEFNSDAQVTLLEGSGIASDGSLVANVRCDSCLSWSGGSMDPTDSSSSWIWAYKSGSALDSTSTSESISMHDSMSSFSLNLKTGTGGSSSNPFASSASTSASGSASASSATASSTGAVAPIASSDPSSSSGSSSVTNNTDTVRTAHAVIMSMLFLVFFPIIALTIYLPYAQKVRYIHGPLQILSLILLIIGLGTGVVLAQREAEVDGYHQVIGYLIVALLVLFQPALGIYQHLYYRKTGGRSPMGIIHRWLGRCVIILGVINGGLGFMQSGPVGSVYVPTYSVVAYSIVAVVVFIIYISVLIASTIRSRRTAASQVEKTGYDRRGYEMHPTSPGSGSRRHRQQQHEPEYQRDPYPQPEPQQQQRYGPQQGYPQPGRGSNQNYTTDGSSRPQYR